MKYKICKLVVLISAFSVTSAALAQDDESDEVFVQSCVNTRILRSPEIIDDSLIVFNATRKRYFMNRLPNECRGLKRHGRISYQKVNRLCVNDWFSVLERSGTKLKLGVACQLGRFEPITEEFFDELRNPSDAPPPKPQPVEPSAIEDVVEEDQED